MMNAEIWDKARAFHGHSCPGLAIGVRACEAAMERLGLGRAGDEEIVCIAENDACGVDAVQAILGCTLGKGNLLLRMTGKQVFTFYERASGKGLRCYLRAERQGRSREEFLHWLLDAPLDEVFACTPATGTPPEPARRFESVRCDNCGELAREANIHLDGGKKLCADCYSPYSRGW